MKDFLGNTLEIGDEVVFVRGKNSNAILSTGKVTNIYKNRYNQDECSVGSHAHILYSRVMKLRI